MLRITQTSSVVVTMRINLNISEFNSSIGKENFINKIATFLGINPNRISIISIVSGSTVVKYAITPELGPIDSASLFNPDVPSVTDELRSISDKLSSSKDTDFVGLPLLGT